MTHDQAVEMVRNKFPRQEFLSIDSVREFLDFKSRAAIYDRAKKGLLEIRRLGGGEPRVPVASLINYVRCDSPYSIITSSS